MYIQYCRSRFPMFLQIYTSVSSNYFHTPWRIHCTNNFTVVAMNNAVTKTVLHPSAVSASANLTPVSLKLHFLADIELALHSLTDHPSFLSTTSQVGTAPLHTDTGSVLPPLFHLYLLWGPIPLSILGCIAIQPAPVQSPDHNRGMKGSL